MQGGAAGAVPEDLELGILGVCHHYPHVMLIMARASECGTLFRPKFRLASAPMLLVSHPFCLLPTGKLGETGK